MGRVSGNGVMFGLPSLLLESGVSRLAGEVSSWLVDTFGFHPEERHGLFLQAQVEILLHLFSSQYATAMCQEIILRRDELPNGFHGSFAGAPHSLQFGV